MRLDVALPCPSAPAQPAADMIYGFPEAISLTRSCSWVLTNAALGISRFTFAYLPVIVPYRWAACCFAPGPVPGTPKPPPSILPPVAS